MATWYMKDGNYPYCEWQTSESSTVLPAYLWSMKDGDYPFRPWQTKETSGIIPDAVWKMKDGDYPYRSWQSLVETNVLPYGIWCQKEDNEPYISGTPVLPNVNTYPNMLWHQVKGEVPYKNWAKFPLIVDEDSSGIIYSKVIIYDYTQQVTMEDYICKVISEDF